VPTTTITEFNWATDDSTKNLVSTGSNLVISPKSITVDPAINVVIGSTITIGTIPIEVSSVLDELVFDAQMQRFQGKCWQACPVFIVTLTWYKRLFLMRSGQHKLAFMFALVGLLAPAK
jgi:hypothetical protein